MEKNLSKASREASDFADRCTFEQDLCDREELKRPIYLGDLIIGYETILPKNSKTDSKAKQRIHQEKEYDKSGEVDLTPIVMPQSSVVVYDDETGKKRRINLRKIAEMENDGKLSKKKLQKLSDGESVCDFVEEREKLKKNSKLTDMVSMKDFKDTPADDVKPTGKRTENDRILDKKSDFHGTVIKMGENTTFTKTDKENSVTANNVVINLPSIPICSDNPFLVKTIVATNELKECETQTTTDYKSFDDIVSEHEDETTMLNEVPVLSQLDSNDDDIVEIQEIEFISRKDFCNICGNGIKSRKNAETYLEMTDNNANYCICLTCNKKVSITERSKHKASCFLSQEEFYYHGCEVDYSCSGIKHEVKFRMVACLNCVRDASKT